MFRHSFQFQRLLYSFPKNNSTYLFSTWAKVPLATPDPSIAMMDSFKSDPNVNKINLGIAIYKDNGGKTVLFESVKKSENLILEQNLDNEYLPIHGYEPFIEGSLRLAYDENTPALKEKRIAAIQTLSGTGAVKMGLDLIRKYLPEKATLYSSQPGWQVYQGICSELNIAFNEFRYLNLKTLSIDFEGMVDDLNAAPEGSVVMLQASGHNPTGIDLSPAQWQTLVPIFLARKHVAFFDMAYQALSSGNMHDDAFGLRLFANNNEIPILLAHSFSQNFGLYGERIGCLSTICENEKEANDVVSQMKILARRQYSSPPVHGARIVSGILHNLELFELWQKEMKEISERIVETRKNFVSNLKDAGSTRDWDHINNQKGLFSFTGLNANQLKELAETYHIYLSLDGRLNIPSLNSKNITYVATAIHQVTKEVIEKKLEPEKKEEEKKEENKT